MFKAAANIFTLEGAKYLDVDINSQKPTRNSKIYVLVKNLYLSKKSTFAEQNISVWKYVIFYFLLKLIKVFFKANS